MLFRSITTIVRKEDGSILENVKEISAGKSYSIAVTKDGNVYTWGINEYENLGFSKEIEAEGIAESHFAKLKEDILDVERVNAKIEHTSVYKRDGNVYTWGKGIEGQLRKWGKL